MLEILYRQKILRRLILLGTPLALLVLSIAHPTGIHDNVFQGVSEHVNTWLIVHLAALPLFGLLALAICLITQGLHGPAAVTSRSAMGVYVLFYSAMVAVAVAIGILVRDAQGLTAEEQAAVAEAVRALFMDPVAGVSFPVIGAIGVAAWIVGALAAAAALYQTGVPWPPLALLVAGGVLFLASHAVPFGPIGLASLFVAVLWLERISSASARQDAGDE